MIDQDKRHDIRTSVEGEPGLPRYFARVFAIMQNNTKGILDIALPDGRVFRSQGALPGELPPAMIRIHNPDLFARLIREGELAFGETYMEGWWSTDDLQALMDLVMDTGYNLHNAFPGFPVVQLFERLRHRLRDNTKRQARRNIEAHYDLGNSFYAAWLDDSMTYSSALFTHEQQSLEEAQRQKYKILVDNLGLSPGDHVLEIGCGWGGFAEYAAGERGLRVTGLTISPAQLAYAGERIEKAGLSDMVTLKLQDYRDVRGSFDGIVSIEMFEAVGERFWPSYFDTLRERLRPGGRASLQIITLRHELWKTYRKRVDFIQKYIFPGGMLPSPEALDAEIQRAGLQLADSYGFADSYSQTLRRWQDRFEAEWERIAPLGFDERFRRMWNFYLTSCAATFRGDNCDIRHLTLVRP